MTDFPMTGPGGPGWCPKRSEQATLHEVDSSREGTRFVLKHEGSGAYFDLPRGAQDAFVWARLDGEHHVGQIAQAFLEEFGSIHADLGGLLDRLLDAGMLADDLPEAFKPKPAGWRLTELAADLAMIRIPIPATQAIWRLIGKIAAPLYSPPAGYLAALLGIAGLVLALGPWAALSSPVPLLEWPVAELSLLAGIGILLGFNLLVDLFEAVGQVAVLARGKRAPGRIGLSFDVGIPGIYIETPDEILLPVEQRVWLTLSPLLGAALVGGCATIALWRLAPATAGETLLLPLLLQKLAWVAWLRCAVHINPLGPSPLYDALRAWWSLPHLRRLAVRALRGQVQLAEEDESPGASALSTRELAVLGYVGMCIVYFVVLARLGTYLLHTQIVPEWTLALETADTLSVIVLAGLLVVLGVPTLLALGGGLLMSLQAGLHAMARSDLFPTTGRLSIALIIVAVIVAVLPRFLVDVFRGVSHEVLLVLAVFLAGVATIEGVRLRRESGQGWGALGGPILAFACANVTVLLLLLVLNVESTVALLAAGFGVLAVALTSISWAGLETARAFRGRTLGLVALLAIACLPLGLLPDGNLGHQSNPLAGPLLLPSVALLGLASVLGLGAWLGGRGGARAAGTFTLTLGWVAMACGLAGWWFTGEVETFLRPPSHLFGGLHLPFLSAALLASGVWLLRRARDAGSRLPEFSRALDSTGKVEQQQVAACGFVLEGLYMGLRDVFGASVAAAAARKLEEADRIRLRGRSPEAEDLGVDGETPEQRAFRYRMAVAAFYRYVRERSGDRFCERVMSRVVGRLPASAHESIGESAPSTLPVLGAITRVSREDRVRLVRSAVPFTDFTDATIGKLADWLGLRWYEPGDVIIQQGDVGDCYYMLADGQARVLLEDPSGDERPIATLRAGDGFGEGALLRHEPRSASVVAEQTCLVLTLERHVFSTFMQENKELLPGVFAHQEDLRLVREIPLFAGLSGEQISVLCRRVRPMKVDAGQTVIQQGDPGDRFYLVREGQLEVSHTPDGGEASVVAQLERGDYFGEIALLSDRSRVASVVTKKSCELLALERNDFHELLGGRAGLRLARESLERMRQLEASTGSAQAEPKGS